MLLFHRKAGKKNRWPLQLVQLALVLWKCATCIKICRKNAVLSCEALFSIGPIRFSRPGLGLPPLGLWWHTKSMISLINEICHLCQRAWPHSIDSHWRFSSLPTQHAIHQVSRLQTRQLVRFLECCPCLGWHLHSCTLAYTAILMTKGTSQGKLACGDWCDVCVVAVYQLQMLLMCASMFCHCSNHQHIHH